MYPHLYRAAESGNWDVIVQYEHQLGTQQTTNKDTVLHVLSRFCDSSFVAQQILASNPKLLLKLNADWETPLHIAARKGHSHIVRAVIDCIKRHGNFRWVLRYKSGRERNIALHEAIKNNRREIIQLLVEEDPALVNIWNGYMKSPLHLAAENGDQSVVALILSHKPVTSYPGTIFRYLDIFPQGNFFLIFLCFWFLFSIFFHNRYRRGRLQYAGWDKRNALHAAVIGNFPECVKLIMREFPQLALENDKLGWKALCYAARFNHQELLRQILSGCKKGKGKALRIAVIWGHIQVAEELLTHCPDCWTTVSTKHQNIIHLAVLYEQQEVLNFILRQSWASELVNGRNLHGSTPLHLYAATKRLLGCELVNHPAVEINGLNRAGLTPLDLLRNAPHQDKTRKDFLRSELEQSGATESRYIASLEDYSDTLRREEKLNKMAETYQVVATLIVAITFAAGFTIPGGYESNDPARKGQPVFLNRATFIAFFFFDYTSLLLSLMALIGLILQPPAKSFGPRILNLSLCGSIIIASLGTLFLSFLTGLYITLPKLGTRLLLFLVPYLLCGPCIVMVLIYFLESRKKTVV